MNPKLEKWLFRLAALAWMAMVTWFSHQTGEKIHIKHPIDKIIHCGTFGVMGFLLCLGAGPRWRWHGAWMAALAVSCFGAFDEFHQHFSEGRSVSVGDWLADTIGGVSASVAWLWAWSQGLRAGRHPKPLASTGDEVA